MPARRRLKVLVVDDSSVVRQVIKGILEKVPSIGLVETAPNASLALRKIQKHDPDVVTLDVEMPGMDGISLLREIMTRWPRPVIMLSSFTYEGAEKTIRALELGAVDFIQKPSGRLSRDLAAVEEELVAKVQAVGTAHLTRLEHTESDSQVVSQSSRPVTPRMDTWQPEVQQVNDVVAIGASTGGTEAIGHILTRLPRDFPAGIVIVQHMPEAFTAAFSKRLNELCAIEVKEAQHKDLVRPGRALIAPGHSHMCLHKGGTEFFVTLNKKTEVSGHRPSVDVLFNSVAEHAGATSLGVLLTGMGRDGADGLARILELGGDTIAQDEASCVVFGMPKAAIDLGAARQVASLSRIPSLLHRLIQSQR